MSLNVREKWRFILEIVEHEQMDLVAIIVDSILVASDWGCSWQAISRKEHVQCALQCYSVRFACV